MNDQEPILTEEDGTLGDTYEHPAFGCVAISRVSGGTGNLFMSNVKHDHFVALRVMRAKMARSHYQDQHYAQDPIVEVNMSMVQFAELMAGMNTGSGVPCTISRIEKKGVPGINLENTNRRFAKEVDDRFKELAKQIDTITNSTREALTAAKVPVSKQGAILSPLAKLEQDLRSNIPFMQKQFAETMEGIVSEAKSVIESYATERGITPGEAPLLISSGDI